MRRGSSLIEALLALLLLQFGMLALAAMSVVTARDLAVANRYARGQSLARNRVEQLRAGPCPAPVAGTAEVPGGLIEFWHVIAAGRMRIVTDSVELALPRGRKSHFVIRARVLCP